MNSPATCSNSNYTDCLRTSNNGDSAYLLDSRGEHNLLDRLDMENHCNETFPPYRPTSLTRQNEAVIRQHTYVESTKTSSHNCGHVLQPKILKEFSIGQNTQLDKDSSHHLCPICNKTYTTKFHWLAHLRTHCPIKCHICCLGFATKQNLKQHNVVMNHTNERPYNCSQCLKTFRRKVYWKRHQRCHVDYKDRLFVCCECQHRCTKKRELIQHYLSHFRLLKFPCAVCNKAFSQKSYLLRHQNVHEGKDMHTQGGSFYRCKLCCSIFLTGQHLEEHTKHQMCEVYRKNICPHCSMTFRSSTDYKMHFLQVHAQARVVQKRYCCSVCNAIFVKQSSLRNHINLSHFAKSVATSMESVPGVGNGIQTCVNVSLHTNFNLAVSTMSASSDTFKTENYDGPDPGCIDATASKSFQSMVDMSSDTLNEYERQLHLNDRSIITHSLYDMPHSFELLSKEDRQVAISKRVCFPCLECDQKFKTEATLVNHLQIHETKDLYPCDECDKTFSSKFILLQHQQVHIRNPLYNHCSSYEKAVTARFYLLQHELTWHAKYSVGNIASSKLLHGTIKTELNKDCSIAGSESFASMKVLGNAGNRFHKESVKEHFSCMLCRNMFCDSASLRAHCKLWVPSAKLWCSVCGQSFGTPDKVKKCFNSHY